MASIPGTSFGVAATALWGPKAEEQKQHLSRWGEGLKPLAPA